MSRDGATRAVSTLLYKKDKRWDPGAPQPKGFNAILDDAASRAAAGVAAAAGKQAGSAARRVSEIALQDEGYIYRQLVAPASPQGGERGEGGGGDGAGDGGGEWPISTAALAPVRLGALARIRAGKMAACGQQ